MTLGDRLRGERLRLKRSQRELAVIGGIKMNAQAHYEAGRRHPTARYLQAVSNHGVDISYVLMGAVPPADPKMSVEEIEFMEGFRSLPALEKQSFSHIIESLKCLVSLPDNGQR